MKENFTKFTCDECKKEITIEEGFPYSKKWIYLYNFEVKLRGNTPTSVRDSHFCSEKCMFNHLKKFVEEDRKLNELKIK